MKLRYGDLPLGEVSFRYLPVGAGPDLSGYTERKLNAGPGVNSWTFKFLENGQQFFSRLLASVKEEGVRNPVFMLAIEEGNFLRYGGSRLWAAHEAGLTTIPVVLADWVERYADWPVLEDEAAVRALYQDQPETVILDPGDLQILHCPHTHLPGSPRNPGAVVNEKYRRIRERRVQRAAAEEGAG